MTTWPVVITTDPIAHASGAISLPGSKSISNRALLLSALADGPTVLAHMLDAEDTWVMRRALSVLGIASVNSGDGLAITGQRRFESRDASLHLGNSGTAFRLLTAALAFAGGRYFLDGVARMHQRPIGDLVDALNGIGARIRYAADEGFPPLIIEPACRITADVVAIRAGVSSQFLSGLLIAAPLIASSRGFKIFVEGSLISEPYIALTIAMMTRFGVDVARDGHTYSVARSVYRSPGRFVIESDASSASYFLALGAIVVGPVTVNGVGRTSVQGDIRFADALAQMGACITWTDDSITSAAPENARLTAIDLDCTHIPDAAMTLAIVALFADGPSTLRNVGSWRVKETDRLSAMATELRKVGAGVDEGADWIRITPPTTFREATIDTYDDHRMAMCFSLVAAGGVPVHIRNPECVSKTFPGYFDRLADLVSR